MADGEIKVAADDNLLLPGNLLDYVEQFVHLFGVSFSARWRMNAEDHERIGQTGLPGRTADFSPDDPARKLRHGDGFN